MKKALRITYKTILGILLFLVVLWLLLQTSFFQNWIVGIVTNKLSKELGTTIKIEKVDIGWLNKLDLKGVYVEDQQKDTLASIGSLQVKITDWFVFKDSAEISYVKLKDANIKLQRNKDSVWNYQFLADYFGGGSKSNSEKKGIILKLKEVELDNITFRELDDWRGKNLIGSVGKLRMTANEIDFSRSIFDIDKLTVESPEFREIKKRGNWRRTDSVSYWKMRDMERLADTLPMEITAGKMVLKVRSLDISNGTLQFYNRRRRPSKPNEFDDRDIIISNLTGQIDDLNFIGDTLFANVDIKANERSGIQIKRMRTRLKVDPNLMEFDKLDLEMNNSKLTNYFAMRYSDLDAMSEFIDSVKITANLNNSVISMEDIAFFAPALKGNNQVIKLTGSVNNATVSNFNIDNLNLETGNTKVTGQLAMKGLIDIDKTVISFNTTGSKLDIKDFEIWAPQIKSLRNGPVGKLGVVDFKGKFFGFYDDFLIDGLVNTKAGYAYLDFSFKADGPKAGYNGNIIDADINAGQLLDIPMLGKLKFHGGLSSDGLTDKSGIKFNGTVESGTYGGYTFKNISADALYKNNTLKSLFNINDPNLAGEIETTLDFNQAKQNYIANGTISTANLKALGVTKENIRFSGNFDINFSGKNIDDFLGYAHLYNTNLLLDSKNLNFDSLTFTSTIDTAGVKHLSLRTNEATADVKGKFNLLSLPNSFQYFLSSYYPAFIPAPKNKVKDQDFSFEIITRNISPFLELFTKDVKGLDQSNIEGSINTNTSELFLNAGIPTVSIGTTHINSINIESSGTENRLNLLSSIGSISINDSLNFPDVTLRLGTQNDTSHIMLTSKTSGQLGNAQLDAFVYASKEGFEVKLNESSFLLNEKKWKVESKGNIEFYNKIISTEGITFSQGEQQIAIRTEPSELGSSNDVLVNLKNVILNDLLPYIIKEPRIEGLASGNVTIEDPFKSLIANYDLNIDQFALNNDSIGTIKLAGNYNNLRKTLETVIDSKNQDYDFNANLSLNLNDSSNRTISVAAPIRKIKLGILKSYLGTILDDIDGIAEGNINFSGSMDKKMALTGNARVSNAFFKVGYTKCIYYADSATIIMGDNFIDFGKINLRDNLDKKRARFGSFYGKMYHRMFDSLSFDLHARTDGMQVLNTKATDNDLFYGNAVAKASLDITGPGNNMYMKMSATPTDSSKISILNKVVRESGEADFIKFKTYGTEMVSVAASDNTNMTVDVDITATPLAKIDVILDDLTGDVIKASGSGNIKMNTSTLGTTTMRGRFDIESGSYDYNYQSLIRRPFTLEKADGNYIEWRGDPSNAILNVKAKYLTRKVSLGSLVGNSATNTTLDQSARNAKSDINVTAIIKETLAAPSISFGIEIPQGSPIATNPSAQEMLNRIMRDTSELLRQVTYLIVFNSFAPYKEGSSSYNPGADLAFNTITEIITREAGKILTNVIQQITGDRSINIEVNSKLYNSNTFMSGDQGKGTTGGIYDRVNVGLSFNKSFLNNRIIFNVGSDFDVGMSATTANSGFQFLPDFSIEFVLTSNRRLRAIVFKRDNLDIGGRRNRQGVSLSYRKDYESIFGQKKDSTFTSSGTINRKTN